MNTTMNGGNLMALSSRAARLEEAACRRLGMDSQDIIMLLFESGCELAERFTSGGVLTRLSAKEVMASNEYWFFWSKHFVRVLEVWLCRGNETSESLLAMLRLARGPHLDTMALIEREMEAKRKNQHEKLL